MPYLLLLGAIFSRHWDKILTIGLSVLAFIVSILAWWTARKAAAVAARTAKYDYTVRLQIRDEIIEAGMQFAYSAKLVNAGLKPVRIDRVIVDYGGQELEKCWHAVIDGRSDIPPAGERPLNFSLSRSGYEEALSKFAITTCFVRLRVRYLSVNDEITEAERHLVALGPDSGAIFYAQRGDALT